MPLKQSLFKEFDVKKLLPIVNALRGYHGHRVIGMDNIPAKGGALVVSNHSLATYDMMLLYGAILQERNRLVRPLMDRLFTKIPFVGEFAESLGARVGNQRNGKILLDQGELISVAPGGMQEALRPSEQKYHLMWEKRKGFVRLAIQSGAPIILAACPRADDIYDVYPSKITEAAYKTFKIPLPLLRGVGLTFLPKPVELIHVVGEPLSPPKEVRGAKKKQEQIDEFHAFVVKKMEDLMAKALKVNT